MKDFSIKNFAVATLCILFFAMQGAASSQTQYADQNGATFYVSYLIGAAILGLVIERTIYVRKKKKQAKKSDKK